MFLILIVAVIATPAFFRRAQTAGVHPGKAASIPFLAAGIVLILDYVVSNGFGFLFERFSVGSGTAGLIVITGNLFLLVGYFVVIRRSWEKLTRTASFDSQDISV